MLLEARHLTRDYGAFRAVDGVDFALDRGEVVGLLGPNGAGKTTTMRMLTGFLPPSAGGASIAGHDVRKDSRRALRHVGYMPENNPLYGEMRVREYLAFRAELKGLARRERRARIAECIEQCAIDDVAGQIVGTLSKGYRQRVGLADAMLARPDVMILDEPTIGLDPNQVRQTRALIRACGREQAVLVSTHILAEAEAICGRVLIIVNGHLVADDTPDGLAASTLPLRAVVEVGGETAAVRQAFAAVDGVDGATVERDGDWCVARLQLRPGADPRPAIAALAAERGWPLRRLATERPSLEEVFHHITRRSPGSPPGNAGSAP